MKKILATLIVLGVLCGVAYAGDKDKHKDKDKDRHRPPKVIVVPRPYYVTPVYPAPRYYVVPPTVNPGFDFRFQGRGWGFGFGW